MEKTYRLLAKLGAVLIGAQTLCVLHAQHTVPSDAGGVVHISGPRQTTKSATTLDLVYGGGPVMRNPQNYLIFWQPPGRAAFPAGYVSGIQNYFTHVGGTPFYSILGNFNDTTGVPVPNSTALAATFQDIGAGAFVPPSGCNGTIGTIGAPPNCPLTDGDIRAEVSHAQAVNGWPTGGVNNQFFVFTPSDTVECSGTHCFAIDGGPPVGGTGDFCAYHSFFSTNTIYAYQPFEAAATLASCISGGPYPNGINVDATLNGVSHEMFEANTDPLLNGWKGPGGNDDENGDKCNFDFGYIVPEDGTNIVLNGARFQIQREWNNISGALHGCAKRVDPPAASITIPASVNFGIRQAGGPTVLLPLGIGNSGPGDENILHVRLGPSDFRFGIVPQQTWNTIPNASTFFQTITFNPLAPPATATGSVTIDTDYTTSAADRNVVPLSGVVVIAPTISKAFPGPTIPVNTNVPVTFKISNPNTIAITGVGFTDALPATVNMRVSTPNGLIGSCGGGTISAVAGTTSISLTGATLGPGASCTFSVNVIATIGGVATNTTTAVTSVEAGNGNTASATVTVVLPPSISKSFGAVSIPLGGTTTLTFKITNPNTTVTLTTVSFTDTLPAGLVVANPNGLTNTCGDAPVAVPGSNIIILTNGSIAPTATCTLAVNVQATAEANVTNSVTVTSVEGGTGNTATATLTIGAFSARYSVNLTQGDSVMHITNTGINGASLLGPGFGTAGNICVNVYAFSPDEQLISCCSCLVTPNALVSLSVNRDIIANTLTQVQPSSVVVKLVGTGAGTTFSGSNCTNSAPTAGTDGFPLAPGVRAWGTTMHQAIPGGAFVITETPFSAISLSSAELSSIAGRCIAVTGNGSGHGTCNSCRTGGL